MRSNPSASGPLVFLLVAMAQPLACWSQHPVSTITRRVADLPTRTWVDDSGYHRVEARLVGLGATHVRLLKENGRFSTPPLARLSQADRQYIATVRTSLAETVPKPPPRGLLTRASASGGETLGQPVVYLFASRELVRDLLPPIGNEQPFTSRILGVPVRGNSRTNANVDVELITDPERVVLELQVLGTVRTNSTAFPSILRVYTIGFTRFSKRFRLIISEQGASTQPFATLSSTSFVNTGISTVRRCFRRLILRLGASRVAAMKPSSDAEGARQQRVRIDQAIDSVAANLVQRLDRAFTNARDEFGDIEMFRGMQLGFATHPTHIEIAARTPTTESITPPPSNTVNAPLVILVHTSALRNINSEEGKKQLEAITDRLQQLTPKAASSLRGWLEDADVHVAESADGNWQTFSFQPGSRQLTASVSPGFQG